MRDRAVIVTGGGAGIGRAACHLLAERGARVGVLDLDGERAEAVAREALERGAPQAVGIAVDVRVPPDVERAMAAIEEALGPVWGLFANAGIDKGGRIDELPEETWHQVIDTNLNGVYYSCKYAVRSMLVSGRGGAIVCTSSPAASVAFGAGGTAAYSASKGGISALVRSLAIDYARYGIRVNALVPGATETAMMWANVPEEDRARMREVVDAEIPLGRLADPTEPARAAVWLLSDDASYVTGSHLICDGGILAKASISV
ncbi:MAG TPA: SDR family NAD(P)-dependent oxidoreductase [Chloroflexota bacterium]|nr:SDR family NAD(P)-dependent oxidoreductase [Chloroflexota bacterium]